MFTLALRPFMALRSRRRARRPRAFFALWRSRAALGHLGPHLLRDIGMTEEEARREAARPPWEIPRNWPR